MVAKSCSRSHGQPVLGVRSAAMISISRAISRAGFIGCWPEARARSPRIEGTLLSSAWLCAGSFPKSLRRIMPREALRSRRQMPALRRAGRGPLPPETDSQPRRGSVPGCIGRPARLEQEPGAPFGIVDVVLQQTCGGDILVLVRQLVGLAHGLGDRLVVVHELAQHVRGRDEFLVVVLDALQLGDMADRAQRRSADLA